MTLIDTIQQNENRDKIKNIKTVKNAKIYQSGNIIYCQHYETVIFAYDVITCEIQKDLSITSNTQIKFLIEAYNIQPELIKNVSRYNKWECRESL